MPRKLKSYQTSIGFYDLAVAAPSMKAALAAWGSGRNLFSHGLAKETLDPAVVAATMAKPGVTLRRPVGSNGAFKEDAELPKLVPKRDGPPRRPEPRAPEKSVRGAENESLRDAAARLEREREQREKQRRIAEAEAEKKRRQQERAIAIAEAALAKATARHHETMEKIAAERATLESKAHSAETRWEAKRQKLEAALRRARESAL